MTVTTPRSSPLAQGSELNLMHKILQRNIKMSMHTYMYCLYWLLSRGSKLPTNLILSSSKGIEHQLYILSHSIPRLLHSASKPSCRRVLSKGAGNNCFVSTSARFSAEVIFSIVASRLSLICCSQRNFVSTCFSFPSPSL